MGVDVDVVVVGSGLNGAWAAKVLAEEGLDVLCSSGARARLRRDVGPAATSPGARDGRARAPPRPALMSFHRAKPTCSPTNAPIR